jgi:hypothetical protein
MDHLNLISEDNVAWVSEEAKANVLSQKKINWLLLHGETPQINVNAGWFLR